MGGLIRRPSPCRLPSIRASGLPLSSGDTLDLTVHAEPNILRPTRAHLHSRVRLLRTGSLSSQPRRKSSGGDVSKSRERPRRRGKEAVCAATHCIPCRLSEYLDSRPIVEGRTLGLKMTQQRHARFRIFAV